MKVSEVSELDGKMCAQLIRAIKSAKWDNLTSDDMEQLTLTRKWLYSIAVAMGAELKPKEAPTVVAHSTPAAPAPTEGIKIKNMGPIGGKLKKKRK